MAMFEKKYPENTPKQHIPAPQPLERALRHVESSQTRDFAFCGARCVCMQLGDGWSRVCVLLGGGDPELLTRDISFENSSWGKQKKISWVQVQFIRMRRVIRNRMLQKSDINCTLNAS